MKNPEKEEELLSEKNISVAIVQRDTLIRPELHLFPFSLCFDNSRECGILHRQRLQRRRCIARNARTPSRISFFLPLSRHGCAYIREKWRRQVLNLVVGVVPSVLPSFSFSLFLLRLFPSFSLSLSVRAFTARRIIRDVILRFILGAVRPLRMQLPSRIYRPSESRTSPYNPFMISVPTLADAQSLCARERAFILV